MKMSILLISISYVALLLLVINTSFVHAVTDSINVNLSVTGGGSSQPPNPTPTTTLSILGVISSPDQTSSLVSWQTNLSALTKISWGETLSYELSSSTEVVPSINHNYLITGLTPGVRYYFELFATDVSDPTNTDTHNGFFDTPILDITPPAIPVPFDATYDQNDRDIDLSWQNPGDADFSRVRIVRSTSFYPIDESDGVLIYEGTAEFFEDTNITPGARYYYSIFSVDDSGNWSGAGVDSEDVPLEDDDPVENEPPVGEEVPDPFENFPIATEVPPEVDEINLLHFIFRQNNRLVPFYGGKISLAGDSEFSVSVDYSRLPEVLKTIGVTIRHPRDNNKIFNFILRVNENKTAYTASVGALVEAGEYPVTITILDHSSQTLKRIYGVVVVDGEYLPPIAELIKNVFAPIGQSVGVAAGLTQSIILFSNVKSAYDLYLVLIRTFWALLGLIGVRRKRKHWGVVYDSVTKRPLDPAYVVVKNSEGKEVSDAITDLDGRYGFLVSNGVYKIEANKTNYQFPSTVLMGKNHDELYDNLYFGGNVATEEGDVIAKNIPLDPVGFDWNEFVKQQMGLFRVHTKRERMKNFIFNSLYFLGFVSAVVASVFSPGLINFLILAFYFALAFLQWYWGVRHRGALVRDQKGNPMPFAIVRAFTANLNQEVKAVVADSFGRFYMLVSPGSYYITIDAKGVDGNYKRVHTSEVVNLKNGVWKGDIKVGDTSAQVNFSRVLNNI